MRPWLLFLLPIISLSGLSAVLREGPGAISLGFKSARTQTQSVKSTDRLS